MSVSKERGFERGLGLSLNLVRFSCASGYSNRQCWMQGE